MKIIKEVLTLSEAAKLLGIDRSNLRKEIVEKRKFTDDEARLSEGTWLITREALKRVYPDKYHIKYNIDSVNK